SHAQSVSDSRHQPGTGLLSCPGQRANLGHAVADRLGKGLYELRVRRDLQDVRLDLVAAALCGDHRQDVTVAEPRLEPLRRAQAPHAPARDDAYTGALA